MAMLVIFEEHLLHLGGEQEPMYIVGCEGIFGTIITLLLFIPA